MPRTAIIVLTWNQRELTLDCLRSLARLDYPRDRLITMVVDNGSTDATAQLVRDTFPQVTVLENDENLGFAEGNNAGLRDALSRSADYIMLLNNDTVVDPAMLRELLAVCQRDPGVGVVGPKMLYFDRPDTIWCAGNRVDLRTGESIRLQAEQVDDPAWAQPQDVDFITACGILVRRQVIEEIGLLDPRFFIYYEETDWCLRARAAGWRIQYVPAARMWHKVSAAMGVTSPSTSYYMTRNVILFLAKNLRGWPRLRALAAAVFRTLLTVAAYTVKPHGGRRNASRAARLFALRDALLGRWGKMSPQVRAACLARGFGLSDGD